MGGYQWVVLVLMGVMPALAFLALFVRFGALIKTVQKLDETLEKIEPVVADLKAWRDASHAMNSDLLERVRRLEDSHFKGNRR